MPKKYQGTVLLAATSREGVYVLRSNDGKWDSAEKLGLIPNLYLKDGRWCVTSVQVEERIYAVIEYFGDLKNKVPGTVAGNRTEFPLQDITSAVDKLVQQQ